MQTKDLLNWGELSRLLAGSRQTVRKKKYKGTKHEPIIEELLTAMDAVLSKLPERQKSGGKK